MATAVKRRKRVVKSATPAGKESWQIIDPDGVVIRENGYGEGAVLALAQQIAYKDYGVEVTLTVRVKTLFGEPDPLYRVVRDEDGTISTWRV